MKSYDNILLSTKKYRAYRDYWMDNLQGILPEDFIEKSSAGNLKTDYAKNRENIFFNLNKEDADVFLKICKDMDFALYIAFIAVFKCFLFKYSGKEDICVAIPVYSADGSEILLNDYIVLRNRLAQELTFKEILSSVKETVLKGYENQQYPFEKVIEELDFNTGYTHGMMNDIIIVSENIHGSKVLENCENSLIVFLKKDDKNISFNWSFTPSDYNIDTILNVIEYFKRVLSQIAQNISSIVLGHINLLNDTEKEEHLVRYNNTKAEYPSSKTVIQLFEEQVGISPDATALVFEGCEMSYRELNDRANVLAGILQANGIQQNMIVAIMYKHSFELVIGIIAILKAGGAYLPIDPEYPEDRIDFMLEDSGASILLTQEHLSRKVKKHLNIIELEKEELGKGDTCNPATVKRMDDLAYIIYTSGSTGKPKGAMIEHRGLTNYVWWAKKVYLGGDKLDFPLYTSISFDLTVTSVFTPLISGNRIIIYRDNHKELLIERIIRDNKVGVIKVTPTHLELIKHMNFKGSGIKRFIVGGEDLKSYLAKEILDAFDGQIEIYNEYGPTETVVGCMIHRYDYKTDVRSSVPIGVPADNVSIYLLNKHFEPVHNSGIGEIFILGDGVARGYINRPELTAEKFVPCPFKENQRMYRTGDLARWVPGNELEYVGRIDHQVKIKGYRIELGEIETKLLNHVQIQEAVVVDFKDTSSDSYLCAYYVSNTELSVPELREYLLKDLPEYMVPAYFVRMKKIPVTINGKLDRKLLPEPKRNIVTGKKYTAPENSVEKRLVQTWQEVLGIDKIGTEDDFFSLGGDSIKAIQISSRAKKYNLKVETKDLFEYTTINQLAKHVTTLVATSDESVVEGPVSFAPIQKWFFERQFTNMHHWNQSVMICSNEGFDEEAVRKAFEKIVEWHDALRMVYCNEKCEQKNRGIEGELFELKVFDLEDKCDLYDVIEKESNIIQGSIDLSSGPLVKLGLFKTVKEHHLLIVIHHLVIDGISWRIIFEDFSQAYLDVINDRNLKFQSKSTSFKSWADKLYSYANSKELLKEINYWKSIEQLKVKQIRKDFNYKDNIFMDSQTVWVHIPVHETDKLLKDVNRAYNTEINDILLTALAMSVKDWSNNESVLVSLEGHGREKIDDSIDISRTVGWFTCTYPIVLDISNLTDIPHKIKCIKESLRKVPNKGIGYGILKYITLPEYKRGLKFNLSPDISFNYLGQFDQNFSNGFFRESQYSTGSTISPDSERIYEVDINGMVKEGVLSLSFSYNKKRFSETGIQKLAQSYKDYLIELIHHCVGRQEIDITPSDLLYNEISIDDLEFIKRRINNL